MSAFLVPADHIDALLTFAIDKRVSYFVAETSARVTITTANAEEIGRILFEENERSVGHRYGEDDPDEMPGSKGENCATYRFRYFAEPVAPVVILKGCACYDYQACETDGYRTSLAHTIIRAVEAKAIRALPGYENGPGWTIDRQRPVAPAPAARASTRRPSPRQPGLF